MPELVAARALQPITIDGDLHDPGWMAAPWSSPFVQTMNGRPGNFEARARVVYDDTSLYVAFQVSDTDLQSPHRNADDHLWEQDCVEVFVDPDGDGRNYFEIQLSPRGVVFDTRYDSRRQPQPFGHVDWQSTAQTGVLLRGTLDDDEVDEGYHAELRIPFTSGLLIGIGETLRERMDTLLAIRDVHRDHGHIQEVIVQNFRARPMIPMAGAPEPEDHEIALWVALARLVLDHDVSVQAPPNLNPASVGLLIQAGLNDFGDVSGAYTNTGSTYWFYKNFLNRDSYDGAGALLKSSVHFTFSTGFSCSGANAAWLGDPYNQMVYGDGDSTTFKALSLAIDVTAHELTHAVTDKTSSLVYSNESGALNEGMCDIFGAAAEAWVASGGSSSGNPASITATANTWKIGEEVAKAGLAGGALRFMNNPTADAYSKDYYPERITGTSDNGGVHGNSGIANLAFYLLSQGGTHPRAKTTVSVTGIGIEKATKIFFKANTAILTSSAKFQDARNATAQAAKDLYGSCSEEWVNTQKSWDAVGVPGTWTPCGTGDTVAPTVSLTAPTAGSTLTGSTTVSATASDNIGVDSVDFYAGTTLIGSDNTAPYSISWNTTTVANGTYSITAKAKDGAGNVGTSTSVSVTVSNSGTGTSQNEEIGRAHV